MHNDYHTFTTTTSSVTAARNDDTKAITVYGKPIFTNLRCSTGVPDLTAGVTIPVGQTKKVFIEGYNLNRHTTTVYVSASPGVYTNTLSAVTAFDLFSTYKYISGDFPAFSAHQVYQVTSTSENYYDELAHGFTVISENTMQINLSASDADGYIDIIIANPAGYATLSTDLSGRIITLSG